MPLPSIPRNPVPTEEELRPYRKKWPTVVLPEGRGVLDPAPFFWRVDEKKKRPDDFQEAFPPHDIDYPAYLESELWKDIRERVLQAANHLCMGCGKKAKEVHHRDYRPRILRGEDLSLLVPLCRKCHKFIHTDANGKHEGTWNYTEDRLAQLVASREEQEAAAEPKHRPASRNATRRKSSKI